MTLVGKSIVIWVSEPWDFESPEGENVINAQVVEVGTKKATFCLVAEAPYEVEVPRSKARGRRFLLSSRYEDDRIMDIAKGRDIMAAVAVVPPGKSDHAAIYALIGSVFLKDQEPRVRRK